MMAAAVAALTTASAAEAEEEAADVAAEDVCQPADGPCPETLPYSSEQPVRPGYHKVSEMRWGLLVAGALTTGAGAALYVVCANSCSEKDESWNRPLGMAFGFMTILAGAPVLLAGLIVRNEYLQRNDPPRSATASGRLPLDVGVAVDPSRGAGGVTLGGAF